MKANLPSLQDAVWRMLWRLSTIGSYWVLEMMPSNVCGRSEKGRTLGSYV